MNDKERYERLLDRYEKGDVDRRTFLRLLGAAGIAAGVSGGLMGAMTRDALAAAKQVRFDGWGGVVSDALRKYAFDPFEKKTGMKVVDGTFGSTDEFLTKVKASSPGEYNIFHASGVFDYARYVDLGFGTVLDESKIPNLKYVMTALQQPFRKVTDGKLSAVPYDYGTTGLAWNTKYIHEDEIKEMGAKILTDEKYKKKIGGWEDWRTRIWYAALATGQDPNDIKDMDAIWDNLRKNREVLLKYWTSGAELMSLLANEEIYVTEAWSGRIAALQQQGHPIGYYDPKNGFGWQECMFVLKGSPMEACEELLNFMLEPKVQIAVAEGQNYPPALDPTKVELTKKIENLPAFDPTGTLSQLTFADPGYWNGHESDWAKKFSRIQKGF